MLPYLKPYKKDFVIAAISMAVVAALSSTSLAIIKPVIDKVFIEHNRRVLKLIAWTLPALFLIKGFFSYLLNYLMAKLGHAVSKTLRTELTHKLLSLDHGYHSQSASADHIARATNDVSAVGNMVSNAPLYLIRDGLTVLFSLSAVVYLNVRFAMFIFLSIPVFAALFLLFTKKLRKITKSAQELVSTLYQMMSEGLSGITTIKIYLYEKLWMARFDKSNEAHYRAMLKYQKITAISPSLMEFLSGVIITLILFYGGLGVIEGSWSAGAFMAFLTLASGAYQPIKHLSQVNPIIQMGLVSYDRILEIQDAPVTISYTASAPSPLVHLQKEINFNNVGLIYPDGRRGLYPTTLSVKKGELLGIAGQSGSGKTTLAMLLARFYDPTEGAITFDSEDIKNLALTGLRRNIAFVTQDAFLFADTIYANIAMGSSQATDNEIKEAARLAHVMEFTNRLPLGLDTHVGERGARLSAGQRQRIAIARAVVKKSQILILDEATSNLDPESEELVLDALQKLLQDKTAIVISHRIQALADTARIIVMEKGRLIEETSFKKLQEGGASHLERVMKL